MLTHHMCNLDDSRHHLSAHWMTIQHQISTLAEYKVTAYIFYHVIRNLEKGCSIAISIDEFVRGRKNDDGSRMDGGTGLTEKSVIAGIKGVREHAWIMCEYGEDSRRYFTILLPEEKVKEPEFIEEEQSVLSLVPGIELEMNGMLYQVALKSQASEEFASEDATEHSFYRVNRVSTQQNIAKDTSSNGPCIHPPAQTSGQKKKLAFLAYLDDFSRLFNDVLHVRENITQAKNLFYLYQPTQETFVELLYEARDRAQKASVRKVGQNGCVNRMPYFFACLRNLLQEEYPRVA